MIDKGRVSSIKNGMAIVIPSWTDEAVTCPLVIPPRLIGVLEVDTSVVYAMFNDVSGEILEVMDEYEDSSSGGILSHIENKSNPHKVTKQQIGLGNVLNISTDDQAPLFTIADSDTDIVSGEPLKTLFGKILKSIQTLRSGLAGKAAASHTHSASNITTGTLPISRGGTGQTTSSGVKSTFGITALEDAITNGDTLQSGHITLPNGLKLCWGLASSLRSGSQITLPISFTNGICLAAPHYNTSSSMTCAYSTALTGNKVTVQAYDVTTKNISASTTLALRYIAVGY